MTSPSSSTTSDPDELLARRRFTKTYTDGAAVDLTDQRPDDVDLSPLTSGVAQQGHPVVAE